MGETMKEVGTNQDLKNTMGDCANAVNLLEKIDAQKYQLAIIELTREWYDLSVIAIAREIADYPRL